jgi:hypothetical protein
VLRHFFALGAVFLLFSTIFGIVRGTGAYSRQPPALAPAHHSPSSLDKAMTLAPLVWGYGAGVFFLVDAIRRKYRGSRSIALALTVVGLLSAGLTSLIYYAIWGHRPIEDASDVFGIAFCPRCLQLTEDREAPGSMVHNVVVGTRYMGSADRCDQCGSVVRTLWLWLIVPVLPLGSYRVISTDTYRFIGRRTNLRTVHVISVYGITLAIASVIGLCYFLSQKR